MKLFSTTAALVLGIVALPGCAPQTSIIVQAKTELAALNLHETENTLVICEHFPEGARYPIPDSIATDLREVLMRAQPAPKELPEDFRGTISPPTTLSWIQFGELKWYFIPPGEPYGFTLEAEAQAQFKTLLRRLLRLTGVRLTGKFIFEKLCG
jgi:hypothetical protein